MPFASRGKVPTEVGEVERLIIMMSFGNLSGTCSFLFNNYFLLQLTHVIFYAFNFVWIIGVNKC